MDQVNQGLLMHSLQDYKKWKVSRAGLTVSPGFHQSALGEVCPWPRLTPPHMCYLLCSQNHCKHTQLQEHSPTKNKRLKPKYKKNIKTWVEYCWRRWKGAEESRNRTCNCPEATWECRTSSPGMQGRGERRRQWLPPRSPSSPQASEWAGSYARCPDTPAALPHLWENKHMIIMNSIKPQDFHMFTTNYYYCSENTCWWKKKKSVIWWSDAAKHKAKGHHHPAVYFFPL